MSRGAWLLAALLLVFLAGAGGGWRARGSVEGYHRAQADAERLRETNRALADAREREQKAVSDASTNDAALRADLERLRRRLRDAEHAGAVAGLSALAADSERAARADPGPVQLDGRDRADLLALAESAGELSIRLAACVRQLHADRETVNGNP